MNVFYADTPEGYAAWLQLWERSAERELFAHPAYSMRWTDEKTRACAAIYEGEAARVLYPFLLRDISKEPFRRPDMGPAFDVITPYGYGGPFAIWPGVSEAPSSTETENLYKGFFSAFHAWALQHDVVSEFVRFSLFSEARPWYYGKIEHNNDNIVASLELSQEELWKGFRHKVRKNVRIATEQGLQVVTDKQGERLDDFLQVYYHTMKRRGAEAAYFLPRTFFEGMLQYFPGKAVFFHVLHQDKVVASELLLCAASRIYSFLGGTLMSYYALRPGELLKVHIMEWARQEGYLAFVIGGGYRPHDGIFSFKKAFAPDGIIPFYTGKMVFDAQKYRLLYEGAGKNVERVADGVPGEGAPGEAATGDGTRGGGTMGGCFFPGYRG
jgi:CelD/BcsL family acetyltransferase involved in cellulose biosynthesis